MTVKVEFLAFCDVGVTFFPSAKFWQNLFGGIERSLQKSEDRENGREGGREREKEKGSDGKWEGGPHSA